MLKVKGDAFKLPIVVRSHNGEPSLKVGNSSSGIHTRHSITRYHFIHEYAEDGFIKIIFCQKDSTQASKQSNNDNYESQIIRASPLFIC
jgi:hypothetical protein